MSTGSEREKQKKHDIKFREVDVYHKIQNFSKEYVTFSESIPTVLCKVNQDLHFNICMLSLDVFKAANEPMTNLESKIKYLSSAEMNIKVIYSEIQYLITTKGISPKKWDYLSSKLMDIFEDVQKWKEMIFKRLSV